jgi:prepilin-type N-terminal cleavage/methylation domain-containing protein
MKINKKVREKGFTLIELLISIALIAVIAVCFLSMFVTGIKFIADSGNKSKIMYESQDKAEKKLLEGASTSSFNITVEFPAYASKPSKAVPVSGEKVVKGTITLFIPKT